MAFVLLPCDLPTWSTISNFLKSFKEIESASQFNKIFHQLHEYCNVGINLGSFEATPKDYFAGLESFLRLDCDESQFFTLTLPVMVDLALNIKDFRPPQGLHYFLRQERRQVSLPRKFVASLLAHIFFCTMPRRTRKSHPTLTDPCLAPLLSSLQRDNQRMKLKAFLNYFRLVALHEAKGDVTYLRKAKDSISLSAMSEWSSSTEKLCSFVIKSEGRIHEGIHENAILACFASPDVTRPALTGWNSQQVETMISFPEILVAAVLAEHLEDNEVFQVFGTLRVAHIRDLKTKPSCLLLDSFEVTDILHNVADAQNYSMDPSAQYKTTNLLRELNKAFVGFSSVTPTTTGDGHSSSSDFISVSRQHSDEEDSGVPRDRIFSSEENNETFDEKQRRMKSFCQRGFNQQWRQGREKRIFLVNDDDALKPEDKTFLIHGGNSRNSFDLPHLTQPSSLPKNTSTVEEKRGDFTESRRINSSISSDCIKSLNRNVHRKRKKKKRNKKNSFEQRLSTETQNETEKTDNTEELKRRCKMSADGEESVKKGSLSKEIKVVDDKEKDLLRATHHPMKFREYSDASTKDSDYLTADLSRTGISQTCEAGAESKERDAQLLMDRVARAIKNIEAEKYDEKNTSQDLKQGFKDVISSHTSHFEVSSRQSKSLQANIRIIEGEEEKVKLNTSDKKVTQKPPLPKTLKSKMAQEPVIRKGQANDGKIISVPNSQEQNMADEEIYFSAFESLELQDGVKTSVKYDSKGLSNRAKEKKDRRKSSFAQRLRETLTRGQSTDSTAKEDDIHMQINEKLDTRTSKCMRHTSATEPCKSNNQQKVIRKLSSDQSYFEDEENLEPFSNRFHNEPSTSFETENERAVGAFETTSEDSESNSSGRNNSDNSNDSVSSRYSFSSDYSSDLNEIYEHVEEILQPLNDKVIGPRGLAVKRFSRSILKRALSDSYKGVIFSLSGLSCFGDNLGSSKSLSISLNENFPKSSEHRAGVKYLSPTQNRDIFEKKAQWNTVVTGNWGCGKLSGDPQMKVMLQWAAASQARGSLFYFYTFGKEDLAQLDQVVSRIQNTGWTVGDLIRSILDFSEIRLGIRKDLQILECDDTRSSYAENPENFRSLFDYFLNSKLIF